MKKCQHIETSDYRTIEKDGQLFVQVDCDGCGKILEAEAFEPIPPFKLKPGERAIQAIPETWKIKEEQFSNTTYTPSPDRIETFKDNHKYVGEKFSEAMFTPPLRVYMNIDFKNRTVDMWGIQDLRIMDEFGFDVEAMATAIRELRDDLDEKTKDLE